MSNACHMYVTCMSHARLCFTDIISTRNIQGVSGDLKWEFTKKEDCRLIYNTKAEILKPDKILVRQDLLPDIRATAT